MNVTLSLTSQQPATVSWTKCSVVRNFHRNTTERFFQTSYECWMLVKKFHMIPKFSKFFG